MKNIVILGSTGSIGQNALDVIRGFPEKFRVLGLSANTNIKALEKQIKEFHPVFVCLKNPDAARNLAKVLNCRTRIFSGDQGMAEALKDKRIDKVLMAISGSGALMPLLQAIGSSLEICLANKEALVMAGSIIMRQAAKKKARIIPIDSEQSAIWQCLEGEDKNKLKNIYLTASGGPFKDYSKGSLKKITVSQALRHPRWKMGKKITVDSATLMNKGLEMFEAMYLFGVSPDRIKIVIHPEAIIHSMVSFEDGVVMAQLSVTDMRIPIQYALSYPERLPGRAKDLDFYKLKNINFQRPDFKKFPCLRLAYQAAASGGSVPCVLNAANEAAVNEFLKKRLGFTRIPEVIEKVINRHKRIANPSLEDILEVDSWARCKAYEVIGG